MKEKPKDSDTRIAIPTERGRLSGHFGHCELFTFIDVRDSQIVYKTTVPPPPHEPGGLPRWLSSQGTHVIIAGGMGMRAHQFFSDYGIEVLVGAPSLDPEEIVEQYLAGKLEPGPNVCDRGEGHRMGAGGCGRRGHSRGTAGGMQR